ncbi:MAG: hypothetical protein ACI87E_003817 [Mariniblastus sp.]|jgi:hypothetical protein
MNHLFPHRLIQTLEQLNSSSIVANLKGNIHRSSTGLAEKPLRVNAKFALRAVKA